MKALGLALLGLAAFSLVVVDLAASGWPASRFLHGDWIQYWLASRALRDGADPYDPTTWRALHDAVGSAGFEMAPGYGLVYPLTTAAATLPFAFLPIAFAAPLWFVAQGATALLALLAFGRRIFASHTRRDLVLLLLLALAMQPAYVLAGDGNVTRFLPGIVAGALTLLMAGHPFLAGLLLGLGVVKPQLLLLFVVALVLFLPWRRRVRLVAGGAVTVGALLTISLSLQPGWIAEWSAQTARLDIAYGHTNLWGLFPEELRWLAWGIAAALVTTLFFWWGARRPALPLAASVALALSLFLAPYAAPLDQAVLLVGVATFLATIEDVRGIPRFLLVVVLLGTSSAWGWLSWTGARDPGLELELAAPALALLLVLADRVVRAPADVTARRTLARGPARP